ncbi:hypothetical protein PMIN03_002349 [Paraphaeosphaeria minitans]
MVHLILTGATGLVGSGVLQQMLANDTVSRISILSRRPVKMAEGNEAKVKVIIHKDFKTYPLALLDELKDAQGCVWALGASQNDVERRSISRSHMSIPSPRQMLFEAPSRIAVHVRVRIR